MTIKTKKDAPLSKNGLAREMASKLDISIAQAEQFLTVYMETITENLAKGTPVALTGFGTFEVRQRAARTGRNPKTGETIKVAASQVVGFKVGAQLKKALNEVKT